jgi:hypothetical protein
MSKLGSEQGTALLGAVLIMLILSVLGTTSINLAIHEIESVKAARDEAVARHLAEAGSDLIVQGFHDPQSPQAGLAGALFVKQYELPDKGPSFFDAQGNSQFTGTASRPDLELDSARPEDNRLLNDPAVGWFRSLHALGRVRKLKVYGPSRPGLLCTVEITTGVGELVRTLSVQLGARTIPPVRAAIQIGGDGTSPPSDHPVSVWAHWGDLKVKSDARFGKRDEVPLKTSLAPVSGQSYADMFRREDRWLDIWIGGEAFFLPAGSSDVEVPPLNVFSHRDPSPGLQLDIWDYELMKKHAMLYGSYYALGRDGLLYQNGLIEEGRGVTADSVFESEAVGDHRGLIFVDTLDQRPPNGNNLGTLSLETTYAEGIFIVNAHLSLKPKGNGNAVSVLSPPGEGSSLLGARIPVQLSGIHVQGVLFTAGDLTFEGKPRLYGALVTTGKVGNTPVNSNILEVWYNYDLRGGLIRGLPLVYVAPGSWQEKY